MDKQTDVMAILKLYELRRDEQMRAARQWYFSAFPLSSAMDIIALYRGESAPAQIFGWSLRIGIWLRRSSSTARLTKNCFLAQTPNMFLFTPKSSRF